jgi:hypothetical protein
MDFMNQIPAHPEWLNTPLVFNNHWYCMDLWSIVNVWVGFCLILFLSLRKVKNKTGVLLLLLLGFEVVKFPVIRFAGGYSSTSILLRLFVDVMTGLAGGGIAAGLLHGITRNTHRLRILLRGFILLLASATAAFFWVGSYGYHYNRDSLNTPGINLFSFSLWFVGGCCFLFFYSYCLTMKNQLLRMLITWICYLMVLVTGEYIGYVIAGVHENSKACATPLFFGLIHGSLLLHLYYLLSPFIVISVYTLYDKLINHSTCICYPEGDKIYENRTDMLITIDKNPDFTDATERK